MSDSQQRYRVVEKLESGGMAEVFRAESEGLQGFRKQVAIKRVLPHLSSKKKFISMFLDEARLSAQLSHSNCVQVFDIGVGDNAFFIVMEFVDGANLKSIIEHIKKAGKDFPVEHAVYLSLELCKGLSYAHELTDNSGVPLHIVHRDMSPPNVLITKNGEVKIVDFGLAKANSQLEKSEPGIIKGKFSYLSPEAAMGQEVDLRTDIFAVGIILWELLSGQRLFLGDTDFQTVKRVQAAQVPSISQINRKVPLELEKIIAKALARDPATRYGTARELGLDLSKFLFKFGVPVSTFDVSMLVQGAMKERQRHRPIQASIIDKLIEEALFEFTSLTDDKAAPSGGAKPVVLKPHLKDAPPPGSPGYVDVGSWIDEIAAGSRTDDDALRASLPAGLSEGNLAALEDDEPSAPSPPPMRAAMATPGPVPRAPVAAPSPRQPLPQTDSSPPVADNKSSGTRVGMLVALVVVAAAGAAAWLTHFDPALKLAVAFSLLVGGVVALASCAHPHTRPVGPRGPHHVPAVAGACPEEMALVQGRFCVDRWEASLVETTAGGEVPFSPYQPPGTRSVRAVSAVDVVPQGYISRDQAEAACEASSKRLCSEEEWVAACQGDPPRQYPYGDERRKGACNDSGISPLHVYYPEEPHTYQPGPMNDPRLNQTPNTVAHTGAFGDCVGDLGVYDMVGNLHEWVMSAKATFRGGYFQDTRINGEGCAYRTTAHAAGYHDYSTGFRCCVDAR